MESQTKLAAASAAKWAFCLSAGFVLGPIVIGLASGAGLSGKIIVEKLVVGVVWLPVLFLVFWLRGAFSNKDPMTGASIQPSEPTLEAAAAVQEGATHESTTRTKPSKWNYIGIGVGIFMLLFLFLPQLISGTLGNQYYLGAAFWVGVIIYSSINISRARQRLRA